MSSFSAQKIIAALALCTLMFLRMVDLAVFDADHDHVEQTHVNEHAFEMSHDHEAKEKSEHESLSAMLAHACLHTCLGAYTGTADVQVSLRTKEPVGFGLHMNEAAATFSFRPPVPPPLV